MSRFFEEDGFSTLGMVVALLISLSLIFTTAQVYRINTEAAAVQDVADAAALAAENEVAEFMIVAKACDAIILSLTLTSFAATSLGLAALCTPVTAELSSALLDAGKKTLEARDSFARTAAESLDTLQCALPFLAAVNALRVASANNGETGRHSYAALAVVVPAEGKEVAAPVSDEARSSQDEVDGKEDEIRQSAREAEEAAREADDAKMVAFLHDCGYNPSYCMYERADSLALLTAAENPLFSSVDSWSFGVALERAKAYYAARAQIEAPEGATVADDVRSEMRTKFYAYAISQLNAGYVHESADSFEANFPLLPRNTQQMRETPLYTDCDYPITTIDGAPVMHAWAGCPDAIGIEDWGSIAQMEQGGFRVCPTCGFDASTLGNVAAASTSIENGFEYHYLVVAQQAQAYQAARARAQGPSQKVKDSAGTLLQQLIESFSKVANRRLEVSPPGAKGVIALVIDSASSSVGAGFETSFVSGEGALGTRAAVSGATLIADPSGEGKNVLSSILDNVRAQGGFVSAGLGVVLDCWSGFLGAYGQGQDGLADVIRDALDCIPLASHSGLGTWAANSLSDLVGTFGLQPANLDALRPALVNTGYVAQSDEGSFSVGFQTAKQGALDTGAAGGVFDYVVGQVKGWTGARVEREMQIAVVEPLGSLGPSIPIVVKLPEAAREATEGLIDRVAESLRGLVPWEGGERRWQ